MMTTSEKKPETFAKIEALLFVSSGLVSIYQLSKALDLTESEVESCLADLETHYKMDGHGLRLMRVCLLYTSPSPRDRTRSRMPSSA